LVKSKDYVKEVEEELKGLRIRIDERKKFILEQKKLEQQIEEQTKDLGLPIDAEELKRLYASLSGNKGQARIACIYCGNLVIVHTKSRSTIETLKWITEFKEYAKGDDLKDIENIIKELVFRKNNGFEISDELIENIELVVHRVQIKYLN